MVNNSKDNVLSGSKYIAIVVGAIVGVNILLLPKGITEISHQDGWISALFGVIYPIYITILSLYIIKKYPNDDILSISKKKMGNLLGTVFNFIFFTFCIFIGSNVIAGYSNLMRSYIVGWVNPFRFIFVCTFVVAYSSYKGLQTIGRISEIALFLTFILAFSPFPAIKMSSILNIKPIFGSGLKTISNGIVASLLSYSGIEVLVLFHPYVENKNKIKWYSFISVMFVMILYGWICFITILYLGPDIVVKSQWPFLLVTQSVTVTIINNYSYLFIFIWSIIVIKCAIIYYYSSMKILKSFMPKVRMKHICIALYPVFAYIALKFGNEINRRGVAQKLMRIYIVFNSMYITLIALIIFLKKDENK